ncbi:hypothetical protein HETIRDRAFT_408719 [Heterobasidion irregulare TC 32-1]|uniref:Uncharacterized protein n=1 Tax=Heterobasidion irregulare (strain TC 32-1) TaxID=747525 RepID=W4KGN2_HETIT|nr:uncharacterized protein HETIRDRAFT_408719 [Heterobasidion irregulare TC 32-1]ETW84864.1 hypothetical protein HETIRDRAFT_408719 [Heterobasidion irregulare TC 32-1]
MRLNPLSKGQAPLLPSLPFLTALPLTSLAVTIPFPISSTVSLNTLASATTSPSPSSTLALFSGVCSSPSLRRFLVSRRKTDGSHRGSIRASMMGAVGVAGVAGVAGYGTPLDAGLNGTGVAVDAGTCGTQR